MKLECINCHKKTVEKLIAKFKPDENSAKLFYERTLELFENDFANPYLATQIHRLAKNILHNENLYQEEKHSTNKILLAHYSYWKKLIENSKNTFHTAAKLAVISNIIDYGAHSVPTNLVKHITNLLKKELAIDETELLHQQVKKANSILYLGDNAGEIVFDKLFIETMKHPNVIYVVRDKPVINDITFDDIEQTEFSKVCKVISNGYDAPSTLLDFCSSEFIKEFDAADLIISKGQGNFEGLMHSTNANIFFMLMAKCNPMAELLGVAKDDIVITRIKVAANDI